MSATITASAIPQGFKALPLPITQLSLSAVLKCGQSFRWSSFPLRGGTPDSELETREMMWEPTHEWRFCLKDRVVCLRQTEDSLFYRSVFPGREPEFGTLAFEANEITGSEEETLRFIRDYFQLDTDLLGLYDTWSANDPVFQNLRSRFKGIRMLRQDPWECLISFICSSNNNISRISQMIQNLCKHFSSAVVSLPDPILSSPNCTKTDDPYPPTPPSPLSSPPNSSLSTRPSITTYHPFPPPSSLSSPSVSTKLRALGFGYRAEYIQKTASMLLEANGNSDEGVFRFLEGLRSVETGKAREELMKCVGVGRKVADCVLLMSLDKREVIPVDTHVHQIALKHYGLRGSSSTSNNRKTTMSPKLYDEVNERLAKIWGDYAGWAHSVLFTADLKSFSTYGLPTPSLTPRTPTLSRTPSPLLSPSPSPSTSPNKSRIKTGTRTKAASSRASRASRVVQLETITPPETETPRSSHKKRRHTENISVGAVTSAMGVQEEEGLSSSDGGLADRVKRRRRTTMLVNKQFMVMEK